MHLKPVDPRYEDVGPLGVSLLRLRPDLREPQDFDRVYRVAGAAGGDDQKFARISGALAAVFPRSQYSTTKSGVRIDVPAGTVFYIGGVPAEQRLADITQPHSADAVEFDTNLIDATTFRRSEPTPTLRLDGLSRTDRVTLSERPAQPELAPYPVQPRTVFGTEPYRAERLRSLLRAAVEARTSADR